MPELDDRWKIWIWQNVDRGCHKDRLFKALHDRGFPYAAIRAELSHEPSRPLDEIEVLGVSAPPESLEERAPERRELAPFLWEFPMVLPPRDCEVFIEAARDRLEPSTVVTDARERGAPGEGRLDARTSSNVFFGVSQDVSPEFEKIESRLRRIIANATGLPEGHQEAFQIVRYGVGEKYDPHRDAFKVGSEYLRSEAQRGGQRLLSFMVYLNDVEEGGETSFPELEISVSPEVGKGVLWPNVVSDGRRYGASLHASVPVVRGEKWVLVCWIRESDFGKPLEQRGISDLRGLDAWLDDPVSMASPDWILEDTAKQLEEVPYLNAGGAQCRGFEKRRLEPELYAEILASFRAIAPELRIEDSGAIGSFIRTVRPDVPPCLYYEVAELNALIHEWLRPMHEEWCRFELTPSACYGFRVYLSGAFLHDHVDRPQTHVISSSICVDLDVHAPWPLHAGDTDGRNHQIVLEPGELLLYESASVLHGRPVPMNGRYHAGLFLHYQPAADHDLWIESPHSWYEKHRP